MEIIDHTKNNKKIAELNSDTIIIYTAQDALDLLGNLYYQGYDMIILYAKNISSAFYDLKNGLAGEILQKFSNYRMQLSIIGDFNNTSSSFQAFMRESNKGNHVNFSESLCQALT